VPVRLIRLLIVLVYAAYLVHVGLLMTILPWSEGWSFVLLQLPAGVASFLGKPAVRGVITAFGVLHLVLIVAEATLPPSVKRTL